MSVPFIDLRRFEPDFMERWMEIARRVSENTAFVGGPEVTKLEESLRKRANCAAVVGCANGTDALQLALRAVDVGPGDVVLLPDATFWATFEAVVNVGARPATVDIDLTDGQMDFDLFVQAVEKFQPKAALLVHLYGWSSARLDEFRAFCRERDLPLVEDGAQSFGTTWNGKSIYEDALITTTSFYPAKVLGSCGDAGAVYCATQELADKVRLLGNHGRVSHYEHGLVGWNSRMGGFDAAWLNLTLEYIDERLASRRKACEWYDARLMEFGARIIGPPEGYVANGYLHVTLQDPDLRNAMIENLKEKGIGSATVYPGAMSRQPGAKGWITGTVGDKNADLLCRGVLNLPLFHGMREEELEEVRVAYGTALAAAGTAA